MVHMFNPNHSADSSRKVRATQRNCLEKQQNQVSDPAETDTMLLEISWDRKNVAIP